MLSLSVSILLACNLVATPPSVFGYDLQLHTRGITLDGSEYVALPALEAEALLDLLENRGPALVETTSTAAALVESLDLELHIQGEMLAETAVQRDQARIQRDEARLQRDAWKASAEEARAGGGIMSSPGFWLAIGIVIGGSAASLAAFAATR